MVNKGKVMGPSSATPGIRGISVIEVLVVLAVLAVVGAIFLPSPEKAAAKADMQAAEEKLQEAIYLARSTAINTQSEVIMHLVPGKAREPGKIDFSFASRGAEPGSGPDAESIDREFLIPPEIRLEAAANEVLFDAVGVVESPTPIELISNRDAALHQRLLIQ